MKIQQVISFKALFEMPAFIPRELSTSDSDEGDDNEFKVDVLSVDTLDRDWTLLADRTEGNTHIIAALHNNKHGAIVGYRIKRDDGVDAIKVVVNMSFHDATSEELGEAGGNALQVYTVRTTEDENKGAGYGYFLYKALLDKGYTVVSDNVQYIGGKAIWMKIVKRSARDLHCVYILQRGKYMRDSSGKPIVYDGSNIPDDVIWGKPNSEDHFYTLLVARK